MKKFYEENIDSINPVYLLEATPFHKENRLNFSRQLTPEYFFKNLYVESDMVTDGDATTSNRQFYEEIQNVINNTENPYAKVDLIHIEGYAGCGKSTFVHHLLWKLKWDDNEEYVHDFTGEKKVEDMYISLLSKRIYKDIINETGILERMRDIDQFEIRCFGDTKKFIENVITKMKMSAIKSETEIGRYLNELPLVVDYGMRLKQMIEFDFLWSFIEKILQGNSKQLYVVFDNVDSISDLDEERVLVNSLKNFVNECNYFFSMNLNNTGFFCEKSISDIISKTKMICFLTTRIITTQKYFELEPDLEHVYGWFSCRMPEDYYSHSRIISHRIEHYRELENNNLDSRTLKVLSDMQLASDIFYKVSIFKRLFNGNIRYCLYCLRDMVNNEKKKQLIEECRNLYETLDDAVDGATEIVLAMVLEYLKEGKVYSEKLMLQGTGQNEKVSLSRIVLTILREKGGRCSFWDLLNQLKDFWEIKEICEVIYALSEANRKIWRRLLVFNSKFPDSLDKLEKQAESFQTGENDISLYSELGICAAGSIYIESVLPRFEFIMSRHGENINNLEKPDYQPLFCESSEECINKRATSEMYKYRFERKIDRVFGDVKKHCEKSMRFSKEVMNKFGLNEDEYISGTYYNYQSVNKDGTLGNKQSYESRLIFSHIGYIERYRRYLLQKKRNNGITILQDINERIVKRIKRYLLLYNNADYCLPTERQNEAADYLMRQIKKIENQEYNDFVTKIEILP